MVRLKNTLNTLSNCIHDLENNIGRENSYDQNMATLDNDVYALTSLVQSCIRDYIYAETLNFDQIKAQLDENNRTIFCYDSGVAFCCHFDGRTFCQGVQKHYRPDT